MVYAVWCLHCAGPSAEGTLSPAPFSYSWEPQRHPRQRFLYCLGPRAHLGLGQRATKYLGTKSTARTLCFCASERTSFVETTKKGGPRESLIHVRNKKRTNVTLLASVSQETTLELLERLEYFYAR